MLAPIQVPRQVATCLPGHHKPTEEAIVQDEDALGWWTISGVALLEALRRAHAGDDPDLVYAELYANSDHEHPGKEP